MKDLCRLVAVLLLAGAATGCRPDAAIRQGAVVDDGRKPSAGPAPAPTTTASTPAGPTGSIAGVVVFAGTPPPPVRIDTSMDPACSMSGSGAPVLSEQYEVSAGKLANVFVSVQDGPPAALSAGPAATTPVVLDQKGCQYVPHVVGIMRGGYVEFRNSDPTMHNVHTMPTSVGNETIDVSMSPRGAAVSKQMTVAETMIPVRCNNHPWMNAYLNVSSTPYFAVTGKDGRFELRGLPPGAYTLAFVQEKLGTKTVHVTVTANQVAKADVSYAIGH